MNLHKKGFQMVYYTLIFGEVETSAYWSGSHFESYAKNDVSSRCFNEAIFWGQSTW